MPTLDTSFLVDLIRKKPEALEKIEALEAKGSPLETTTVNILELCELPRPEGRGFLLHPPPHRERVHRLCGAFHTCYTPTRF
jgi:predicted nucleic acid-binding protein